MDTPTSTSDNTRPTRSRRRSANRFRAAVRRIWQDWWVEILIGVIVVPAVFLLVERMSIRQTLWRWLLALWYVCIGAGFFTLGVRAVMLGAPWWTVILRWVIAAGFVVIGVVELRRALK